MSRIYVEQLSAVSFKLLKYRQHNPLYPYQKPTFSLQQAGGDLPEQLQQVVVTIANQQTCATRYQELKEEGNNWPTVQDGMVC